MPGSSIFSARRHHALLFIMNDMYAEHIGTLYRFCAHSLSYPTSRWFTEAYLESFYHLLDLLEADEEKQAIRLAIKASDDPIEELQVEYTRLFINGAPHVAAPPYGSVYIDRGLQGQHAEKTLLFYRKHGFELKNSAELPDHIVHQLEFLALLAEKQDLEASRDFLQSIFLPWFSLFLARVLEEARHPLYRVIVQLIDYLTKEDDEHGIQPDEA